MLWLFAAEVLVDAGHMSNAPPVELTEVGVQSDDDEARWQDPDSDLVEEHDTFRGEREDDTCRDVEELR